MFRRFVPYLVPALVVAIFAACGSSSNDDIFAAPPPTTETGGDGGPAGGQASLKVIQTGALTTSEAGGRATFTVALGVRPVADVLVPVASSNEGEIKVEPTALSFTADNWDKPQTVTLIGQDDAVDDGDKQVVITLGPTQSADLSYSGFKAPPVDARNTDDDIAGIDVSTPSPSNNVTETGGEATFTVKLKSQPTGDVTIGLGSSNVGEGKVDKTELVFTPMNWQTEQTVKVTGQDDSAADGDQNFNVVLAKPTSMGDGLYGALAAIEIAFVNLDDDTPGFFVFPPAQNMRTTTEAGGTTSFSVRLRSKPAADVTIPVSSSKPGEGTAGVTQLVFTPQNFDQQQTVTVTGKNDDLDDGDQTYKILLGAATSTDNGYNGLDPTDIDLTNTDDDTAGILVGTPSANSTGEDYPTTPAVTIKVKLQSQPTGAVTIGVSSNKTTEGQVDVTQLVFDDTNWKVEQTITVTGQDDSVDDGNQSYKIVLAQATSTDAKYAAIDPNDVSLTNVDNDTAGVYVSDPYASATTTESGGKVKVDVKLQTQPTADVSIPVSVSKAGEATVDKTTLTFTSSNWMDLQTVTVTGIKDDIDDGDQTYQLVLGAASGGGYGGIDPADKTLTNTDIDTAGITVSATTGSTNELNSGTKQSFTIVLDSKPAGGATVSIPVTTSSNAIAVVSANPVTFNDTNWNVAVTVTITAIDDAAADASKTFDVLLGKSTSTDTKYNNIDPADFTSLTNVSACGIGGVNAASGEQCDDANATLCDGCEVCQKRYWVSVPASATVEVDNALSAPAGTLCIEAWAQTTGVADAIIASSAKAADDVSFMLHCSGGTVGFKTMTATETVEASAAASSCDDGKWHHFAGCRDIALTVLTNTVFLDGKKLATTVGTTAALGNGDQIIFGGAKYGPADGLAGAIDEVRLSNTIRYTADFTPPRRLSPGGVNPIAIWHFDEGSGTTGASSPVNYAATLKNGAAFSADTGYTPAMCVP